MAAVILALVGLAHGLHVAWAETPAREIPALEASSPSAGAIVVTWETPSDTDGLSSYRVSWGPWEDGLTSHSEPNTDTGGNAYPDAPASRHTITGLADGDYVVAVRPRYDDNQNGAFRTSEKVTVSGEGSEPEEPEYTPAPDPTPTPEPDPTPTPEPEDRDDQGTTRDQGKTANAVPTASDGRVTTNEDTGHTFAAANFNFADSDTGDTLSSVKIVTLPATGRGALDLDGTAIAPADLPKTVTKAGIDAGKLTYTPPANANGAAYASFTFRVNDGADDSATAYTMTIDVTAVNDPATGAPTITGTAQVGQTLTAVTTAVMDADGLTSPAYAHQWIRANDTDADISGATSSTYTLVAADEGQTIKVKVRFTDDAGNEESAISAATAPVRALTPFTAEFRNVPEQHDGETAFRLELYLNKVAVTSWRTVAGGILDVSGGDVTGARRLDPDGADRSKRWEVTVEPTQAGDITITLPVLQCTEANAVCANGQPLARAVSATVAGQDDKDSTTRDSRTTEPEPEEELQTAQQQQAQDSVTLPSNTLLSNINQSPGSPVTVSHPIGQVSIPIAIPDTDDIRGYRINTIRIRVSGIDSGEVLSGILYDRAITDAPLIALGRSKYAIGNATIQGGIATFSPPSSLVLRGDKHLRISVSAGAADIGLTSSNAYDQTPISTWSVKDVYQRTGNLTWTANSNPAQVLIAGAAVSRPPAPEPPPRVVPDRPSAPDVEGATTYRVGRWQSVSLDSTGDIDRSGFERGLYKVALAQDTTYRLEFRTANTHTASNAFDAAAWFHNLTIDPSSVFSGTPSYVYESTCEAGDELLPSISPITGRPGLSYYCVAGTIVADTTKPVLSLSSLLFNDSVTDAPFLHTRTVGTVYVFKYQNSIHHEFRTPAINAAGGPEHCNEDSGVDHITCVHKFDFPHAYYVRAGTGISSREGDYGAMQFRISRGPEQSATGMTAPYEEGEGASNPNRENLATLLPDGAATTDGAVDFAGDVDWFNFSVPEGSKCNLTAAGRDVGGNTASGLRMRAFELPGGALKAPSRGSLRSSLSNYRETERRILEVTGSGIGGYTITATCSPLVTAAPPAATSPDDDGRSRKQYHYDDYRPSFRPQGVSNPTTPEPTAYGHIDISSSRSRTGDGEFEHYRDSDHFRVTTDGESRVKVELSGRSATVPAHMQGTTAVPSARILPIDKSRVSIHTATCRDDGGVEPDATTPGQAPATRGVSLSANTPRVGTAVTATLTDDRGTTGEDGAATPEWQWSLSDTASGSFTEIAGETSTSYTPLAADEGKFLKARVTFTDDSDNSRNAEKTAENPVQTSQHTSPLFAIGSKTLTIQEHIAGGTAVYTFPAVDDDGDRLTYSVSGTDGAAFNEDFTLNSSTGRVTVKTGGTVDHDYRSSYRVNIDVTDGEDSSGNTETTATTDDTVSLTINVTNVREIIPTTTVANVVYIRNRPENLHSFQVDNEGCFFVIVGWATGFDGGSVGGYRLTVTDEGAPPHPAKDDMHSPLMYDAEDVFLIRPHRPGMTAFITGDSHTEGGTTYTPSTSIGNVPGDGRIDAFDDVDLFKRRLVAGTYDVILRSQAGETSSNKDTARRSGNGKIRLAFSVHDSAGGWVTLLEALGGREVNALSASPSSCSPTSSSDEEYSCRNMTYATVQIDRSGDYFVAVRRDHLPRNNPQTGDYSVEIRAVRDASLSRLQPVPSGVSDTRVTVRATVSDLRGAAVHLQYKKAADTAWTSFGAATDRTRLDDRFASSVIRSISGLDPDTSYNVRASLESDFSSGVQTVTVRTTPSPGISRVTRSNVTHEGASVTVRVSNAFDDPVQLWYAPDGVTTWDDPVTMTATRANPSPVFELSDLDADTAYNVRVSLTAALPGANSLTFRTQAAP